MLIEILRTFVLYALPNVALALGAFLKSCCKQTVIGCQTTPGFKFVDIKLARTLTVGEEYDTKNPGRLVKVDPTTSQ